MLISWNIVASCRCVGVKSCASGLAVGAPPDGRICADVRPGVGFKKLIERFNILRFRIEIGDDESGGVGVMQ